MYVVPSQSHPDEEQETLDLGNLAFRRQFGDRHGAVEALATGRSLLPVGIREVVGAFGRGDAVSINDLGMRKIGKGLAEYSAADIKRIVGANSSEIESILGFKYRDSVIHRDDMVLDGR